MKRMFFAVLILLISGALPATAADQILLSEDWEAGIINPTKWLLGGSPPPEISTPGRNSAYALNCNGDSNCDSAVYTLSWFTIQKGIAAEFWLKPFECLFCPNLTSRAGFTSSARINSPPCGPVENYFEGVAYVELDTRRAQINYHVKPFGVVFSEAYPDFGWHQYRIEINQTGSVSFFRDGQLKASNNQIILNFGTKFQYWGQANFGPNLIDDILIVVPQTDNLLFDSEVDDYTVVSVDPPDQLPPQPLKGKVRITAKMQGFINFDIDSALVIAFTSLDENYRFGGGSIQVAVPESVSPDYELIQAEWTYYNPDCDQPVSLGIPQIDCSDSDFLFYLISWLYPPPGGAVISSLGLDSSIQCADGSNDPYDGTLFEAHNTHDNVHYLLLDPADFYCTAGEPFDGKSVSIVIPIQESIADALDALNASKMALNVRLLIAEESTGLIYDVDILADQLSP